MAKAGIQEKSDTELRKRGEQIRLDTLVVHAVNDEYYSLEKKFREVAKALNILPREYGRKVKT